MTSSLRHPAVDAALSTAATLLGMEVVFIGGLDDTSFRFDRVLGSMPGLVEGMASDRTDTFCHRMLSGGPCATEDAGADDYYAGTPIRERLGITSYVGVPIRDPKDGHVVATLCGIDRRRVSVDEATVGVLRELAGIIAAHLPEGDAAVVIRRTPDGWQVGERDSEDDLVTAMVLADLLQEDFAPGARPDRASEPLDELNRLRLAVSQLEHALAARVTVEQAIGVLAERLRIPPREAFERLRKVARRGGRKVHDLSRDVVGSVTEPVELPAELSC